MLYVKGNLETVAIRRDNLFTKCPKCGKDHTHGLDVIMKEPDFDLFGTTVYCEECSELVRSYNCDFCKNHQIIADGLHICTIGEMAQCIIERGVATENYLWCNGDGFEEGPKPISCDYCLHRQDDQHGVSHCEILDEAVIIGARSTGEYFGCKGEFFEREE